MTSWFVAAYLVTGNPGSGKSALARELRARGFVAIDPDYDPELSYWEDPAGRAVALAEGPSQPDRDWLHSHRWVWNRTRMEELLSPEQGPVFVCGISLNLDHVLDLFERMFLLQIDEATQEARLVAHDADNPPGRGEAGREQIRDGRTTFEAQMSKLGAYPLDGGEPTVSIADALLALVCQE